MSYGALREAITDLHAKTVGAVAATAQRMLLVRNWVMGAWIVEFEQTGADRAAYGTGLLKRLAKDLGAAGLQGTSPDALEKMRRFYRMYPQLWSEVSATASRISLALPGSPYQVALPSAEELRRLMEADRARIEQGRGGDGDNNSASVTT